MIEYEPQHWVRIAASVRGSVGPRMLGRVGIAVGLGLLAVWGSDRGLAIPPLAHTLIGVALGLLLVFRTNASYGRYVEARALLGRLVVASRDLARQVAAHVAPSPGRSGVHHDLARWLAAFYGLLVQDLRGEDRLDALGPALTDDERERLAAVQSRPPVVAAWISARLAALSREGLVPTEILHAMDRNVSAMLEALGGCERIRRTPVPFAYAQHIKVFLVLFCYTVPFAMAEAMAEFTPVAAAVLTYALFGIDEIGVEIEDPFGYDPNDLPLERIEERMNASVRAILDDGVEVGATHAGAAAE